MVKLKSGIAPALLLVLVGVILLTAVYVSIMIRAGRTSEDVKRDSDSFVERVESIINPTPKPSPIPFEELTIPYLRNREYKSELGDLKEYSKNGNFTSYLTSYDSDGLKVNGLLTIPNGEEPDGGWPAIVFVHGYIAPTIYRTTERYIDHVNYLARSGFVVFKIDLRGHGESEGDPAGGYYSGDYVIDVLNARAALASSGFVNPKKIGTWGHSMAGNVTFRSFVAQNIPASVIWAGAVYTYDDQQEFGIDDNSYRPPPTDSPSRQKREELRRIHGNYLPDSEFWKMVVPTNYLDGVMGAVQIHHAVDDNVVNVGYSRNLMDMLDGTSIEHELFEYSSGGHNMTGATFTQAMQRTVEFFRENL